MFLVKFAPYYDTILDGRSNLSDIVEATGLIDYQLAYALGGPDGCTPKWGGQLEVDDPVVLDQINAIQTQGGIPVISLAF